MSERNAIHDIGDSVKLELLIVSNHGVPQTGLSPTVTIYRASDNKYIDFDTNTFVAVGGNQKKVMTELGNGIYHFLFKQSDYNDVKEETYTILYRNTGAYAGADVEIHGFGTLEIAGGGGAIFTSVWTLDEKKEVMKTIRQLQNNKEIENLQKEVQSRIEGVRSEFIKIIDQWFSNMLGKIINVEEQINIINRTVGQFEEKQPIVNIDDKLFVQKMNKFNDRFIELEKEITLILKLITPMVDTEALEKALYNE